MANLRVTCVVMGALLLGSAFLPMAPTAAAIEGSRSVVATMRLADETLPRIRAEGSHSTYAMDSLSPDDLWAVGGQGARESGWARHWDGQRWTAARTPLTPNVQLRGVAMITTDDVWAVGSSSIDFPVIEHWDGTHWRITESPQIGGYTTLQAVDAVSAVDVWAVGSTTTHHPHPLIEHWDGSAWSVVHESAPRGEGIYPHLSGVVALAPDDVWAVGATINYNHPHPDSPLIEHWDGDTWTVQPLDDAPPDASLSGVSASGPDDIWAVGSWIYQKRQPCCIENNHGLIAHFDGSGWTTVKSPREPATTTTLDDVAAVGPGDAWAVGWQREEWSQPIIEHWDGRRWHRIPAPDIPGAQYSSLTSVTAPEPDNVLAGGHYYTGTTYRCLTLIWDGTRWSQINRHRTRTSIPNHAPVVSLR